MQLSKVVMIDGGDDEFVSDRCCYVSKMLGGVKRLYTVSMKPSPYGVVCCAVLTQKKSGFNSDLFAVQSAVRALCHDTHLLISKDMGLRDE